MNAAKLCEYIGIPFTVRAPRGKYYHGWGTNCANPKPMIYTWDLYVIDANGRNTTLTFDLVDGESPLLIGLDVKRHSDTINIDGHSRIVIKRPHDEKPRVFLTYIMKDEGGDERMRMDIIPHAQSTNNTLMASTVKRCDINLAKKLHRFTHKSKEEMKRILTDSRKLTPQLEKACSKVHDACEICTSTGRPANRRHISLTHINAAFNMEIQADFLTAFIKGEKYEVLNIVDAETKYGERTIANCRNGKEMMKLSEKE